MTVRIHVASLALMASVMVTHAQRIAARHYDVADGLGHNTVSSIIQDSRGFIWIGTYEGLTRFDGHAFRNYSVQDGMPHAIVHKVLEDAHGHLWAAPFSGGLARLSEDPRRRFEQVRVGPTAVSNTVLALALAADGALWCASEDGLYRGVPAADGRVSFQLARPLRKGDADLPALRDHRGRLWFTTDSGLLEVEERRISLWPTPGKVNALAEDRQGRLIASLSDGLFEFAEGQWRRLPAPREADEQFGQLLVLSSGRLLVATSRRLLEWSPGEAPQPIALPGLSYPIKVLYQDKSGAVWIGTETAGIFVVSSDRIVSFTTAEGLPHPVVRKVVEGPGGRIFAATDGGVVEIAHGGVTLVRGGDRAEAKAVRHRLLFDSRGDWWYGVGPRLYRIRGPDLRFDRAEVVLGNLVAPPEEWPGPAIYEDSQGTLWAAGPDQFVFRIERSSQQPRAVAVFLSDSASRAGRFATDRAGNLWVGSFGQLIRRRSQGTVHILPAQDGLPEIHPRSLFVDSRGWLWVGLRYRGVSVSHNPDAERPVFRNHSMADGLASDTVWAVCEGGAGEIYLGTARGLDRLDPASGVVRHYSPRDGLAGAVVNHCMHDSRGRLWISTMQGISRLEPSPSVPAPLPPVSFTRLRWAGEDRPVGERGALALSGYELPPSSDLSVEFVTPSAGGALRYQYLLDPLDREWSSPSAARAVNFARLGAGSYRLRVRAVDGEGRTSPASASLEFRVIPPVWRRWWFLTLAAAAVAAATLTLHHLRVRHILAMERLRRQVALDLHDEIGSGLTEIAMMSEVAKREMGPPGAALLGETANLARSLRSSMSDIVWAIDPRRDHLNDLLQRMRQSSFHLLEGSGIEVEFHVPDERRILAMELAPHWRRHFLLIFKEALANVARHAQASRVRIGVAADSRELRLTVQDNGRGFDPEAVPNGHGLHSLRTRAAEMKGVVDIDSAPGRGTTVSMTVRLGP